MGRPSAVTERDQAEVFSLFRQGASPDEVQTLVGISGLNARKLHMQFLAALKEKREKENELNWYATLEQIDLVTGRLVQDFLAAKKPYERAKLAEVLANYLLLKSRIYAPQTSSDVGKTPLLTAAETRKAIEARRVA